MEGDGYVPVLRAPLDKSEKTAPILHHCNLSRRGTLHVDGERLCDLLGSSHRQNRAEAAQNNR